jgi:hypothetical protein
MMPFWPLDSIKITTLGSEHKLPRYFKLPADNQPAVLPKKAADAVEEKPSFLRYVNNYSNQL